MKILVPSHFEADLRERLSALPVELVAYDANGALTGDGGGAAALFRWWLSAEDGDRLLREFPVEWIHTASAGVEHILTDEFRRRQPLITNSAGVHAVSIAEWVVLVLLAAAKDFRRILEQQRNMLWEQFTSDELAGRHVVIVGAGRIATEVAIRLRPFGVRLTAVRRSETPHRAFDDVVTQSDLADAVASADWLIVAAPSTAETKNLVNRAVLERLPPHAFFINVARGDLVDEPALIELLQAGRIGGAALDVFDEEPLPATSPFWGMKNVTVLPHTTWRSRQVRQKQIDLFVENVRRFVSRQPLLNVVDVERGY